MDCPVNNTFCHVASSSPLRLDIDEAATYTRNPFTTAEILIFGGPRNDEKVHCQGKLCGRSRQLSQGSYSLQGREEIRRRKSIQRSVAQKCRPRPGPSPRSAYSDIGEAYCAMRHCESLTRLGAARAHDCIARAPRPFSDLHPGDRVQCHHHIVQSHIHPTRRTYEPGSLSHQLLRRT